jgi:PHD/YefM family antitoxin component YafN of YafNO toxin-antitoxin module
MTISLAEDVKTVEDLEKNPRALVEQARRTGRPVVLAEAGKPTTILLTAERYEWLVHLVNLSRLLNEGEESIRAGKTRPMEEVFAELLGEKRRTKKGSR